MSAPPAIRESVRAHVAGPPESEAWELVGPEEPVVRCLRCDALLWLERSGEPPPALGAVVVLPLACERSAGVPPEPISC